MEFPDNLKYTRTHEWVRVEEDGTVLMGVTDYAQDAMGDLVYIVESVKAVQDVYAPLTGRVTEVNDELPNSPEVVNQDPYGDGWMVRLEIEAKDELEELMGAAEYKEMVDDISP